MKSGDILLYKGKGFWSWVISVGTGSAYTHVSLCVDPGKNLLIEAIAGGGVRASDIRFRHDYDVYRVKSLHQYDLDKVVSFLVGKLNLKYDYIGVIALGILKVLRLKKQANKWQREKDYFCSEIICAAFRAGGLDVVPGVAIDSNASPKDIAESEIIEITTGET